MTALNPAIQHVEIPSRIRALPIHPGFRMPVPWFVARPKEGEADYRIMDGAKMKAAIERKLCWICGGPLGTYFAFPLGPMCVITRTTAEPPSHRDCAVYAAKVCPFLVNPNKGRRDTDLPEGRRMAGIAIKRNPAVIAVWITHGYKTFRAPSDGQSTAGILFNVGDPTEVLWFNAGQPASREAVLRSIETGLPALEEIARSDPHPDALECLKKDHVAALAYAPLA
jgi:hypothetical protein